MHDTDGLLQRLSVWRELHEEIIREKEKRGQNTEYARGRLSAIGDCMAEIRRRRKMTCPKCGKEYTRKPALSREDNRTLICPECGIREALSMLGIDEHGQEEILRHINEYERRQNNAGD